MAQYILCALLVLVALVVAEGDISVGAPPPLSTAPKPVFPSALEAATPTVEKFLDCAHVFEDDGDVRLHPTDSRSDGIVRGITNSLNFSCQFRLSSQGEARHSPAPGSPNTLTSTHSFMHSALHLLMGLPEEEQQSPFRDTSFLYFQFMQGYRMPFSEDTHRAPQSAFTTCHSPLCTQIVAASGPTRTPDAPLSMRWGLRELWERWFLTSVGRRGRDLCLVLQRRLRDYPWHRPTAMGRSFLVRRVQIRFPVSTRVVTWRGGIDNRTSDPGSTPTTESRDAETAYTSSSPSQAAFRGRRGLFSDGSAATIRVISYPPTPVPRSTDKNGEAAPHGMVYECHFSTVIQAREHLSRIAQTSYRTYDGYASGDRLGIKGGTGAQGHGGGGRGGFFFSSGVLSLLTSLLSSRRGPEDGGSSLYAARSVWTPSQRAADKYQRLVMEELGPYQPPSSLLPSWMLHLLGRRTFSTHQELLEEHREEEVTITKDGAPQRVMQTVTQFSFLFEASLPSTRSMCLAIAPSDKAALAQRAIAFTADGEPMQLLHVTSFLAIDWVWLRCFTTWIVLLRVAPLVQRSPVLQYALACLCGVFFVALMILMYVVREVQRMTVGKMGVVVLLTVGGLAAAAEALLSVAQHYLFLVEEMPSEVVMGLVGLVVMLCAMWVGLMRLFLSRETVSMCSWWVLFSLQALALLAAGLQNTDATVLSLVARLIIRLYCFLKDALWPSSSVSLGTTGDEPKDVFPKSARAELSYAPPIACEGRGRRLTPEQYNKMGSECTRRALEELAGHVRANPAKYVHRLRNPNAMAHWAGVGVAVDSDSESDE